MRTGTSGQARKANDAPSGLRLGGARADFVAGLGRKVTDLRAAVTRVRECPLDLTKREELRKKLQALASGARLMKFDAMDRAVCSALGTIDRAAIDLPLDDVALGSIDQTLEDLPALAWGDDGSRSSRVEAVAKPVSPSYSALVVGPAMIGDALLDPKDDGRSVFACNSTPDAQAAFDLARATEPDLVVLDADLDCASELVDALMDDPITEAAPIVVVGSFLGQGEAARYVAMGVAKTLSKPTSKEALRTACVDALEALRVEACSPVPAEVRLSTSGGAALSIAPIGEVARSDRARIRARGPAVEVKLQGRRIVVADDDPAVVWFMADLLKSAGCTVYEAFDGKKAIELSYRTSPDLVICDILMPEMDGFTVCRALRKDVALRDVPVILLSWKEDLLQRVRELGAGAAGYLRKESDTRAILARVREALRPRGRIEMRLRDDDGEVRGRLDGMSVRSLLELVCAMRPDARVAVRDASFDYEVDIRGGMPQRATRTAGDGSCLEGMRALAAMLGIGAGRFTVTTSTAPVDGTLLEGNLPAQLARPIARARAATSLLTGAGSLAVKRVYLDDAALDEYLRATPALAKSVALRMAEGTPPREIALQGGFEASLVEDLVCDLAARGVVCRIDDAAGEDLLAPEVKRMAEYSDMRASLMQHTMTPPPAESLSAANDCVADRGGPLCQSPSPGSTSTLEEAVLREVAFRSPTPAQLRLPLAPAGAALATKKDEGDAPYVHEGTPPHDQLLALAEPTVIDGTSYGADEEEPAAAAASAADRADAADDDDATAAKVEEPSESIRIDEESMPLSPTESRAQKTPFTSVTATSDEPAAGVPQKRRTWPMVAFIATTGVVAWAVLHFGTTGAHGTKSSEKAPPPAEISAPAPAATGDEVTYTNAATEAALPSGQGVLDVSAPGDAVVLVDGAERGRGAATLPLWAGSHDVRVSGTSGDRGKTVEVRAGRVTHVVVRLSPRANIAP